MTVDSTSFFEPQNQNNIVKITQNCQVQSDSGEVFVLTESGALRPVEVGEQLSANSLIVIQTGALNLQFDDGSLLSFINVEFFSKERPVSADIDTGFAEDISDFSAQGQLGAIKVVSPQLLVFEHNPEFLLTSSDVLSSHGGDYRYYTEHFGIPVPMLSGLKHIDGQNDIAGDTELGGVVKVSLTLGYGTGYHEGALSRVNDHSTGLLSHSASTTNAQPHNPLIVLVPPSSAVIAGNDNGVVSEDNKLNTAGKLTIDDPNFGENVFIAGTQQGAFGNLHIDSSGQWNYSLENHNPLVQQLGQGESLLSTYLTKSADGTLHQIQITIHGTNDAPTLVAQSHSVTEDGSVLLGQMRGQDIDHGDSIGYSIAQPVDGLTLHRDGSYSFDPSHNSYQHLAKGVQQTITVPVTVTDSHGATATESLEITITGTNDFPKVSGALSLASGKEDVSVRVSQSDLLANVTDVDSSDNLSIAHLIADHGTITTNHDGSFTFTPTKDYNGPVHFSYEVLDGHGGVTLASAFMNLAAAGDTAVITGQDTGIVSESRYPDMSPDYAQSGMAKLGQSLLHTDGKLDIVDPDSGEAKFDTKGGTFSYSGQYGHLLLMEDGHWSYIVAAGSSDWVGNRGTLTGTTIDHLGAGQELTDTITVHSIDGTPHDIVITIHGDNDRPYCSSEVQLAPGREDTQVTITEADLLKNTVDVDANDQGKLTISNLRVDHGSIQHNSDGTYTLTPEANYNGQVHLSYDVKDAHSGVTSTGAMMNLAAVGDSATFSGDDSGSLKEDVHIHTVAGTPELYVTGLLNVHDPDAGQERFQFSQFGEHAVHDPFGGHLQLDRSGIWTYKVDNSNPALQLLGEGQTEVVTYRVRSYDGTTHDINITITGTNDTPVLQGQSQSVTEDGSLLSGQMIATDVDSGDTLSFSPGVKISGFSMKSDGSYTYDPTGQDYQHLAAGQTEKLTIPVTVTDSQGATSTQNLEITVTGTNDAPVVSGPTTLAQGKEDTSITLQAADLLSHATDVDTTDALVVQNLKADHGSITSNPDGSFTFTPSPDYNGPVSLTYDVTDGQGGVTQTSASMNLKPTGDTAIITAVGDTLKEDLHVNVHYDLKSEGYFHVVDPDGVAESKFATNSAGVDITYQGTMGGSLQLYSDGHYYYTHSNVDSKINALKDGEQVKEQFIIRSADGTQQQVEFTIQGTSDRPTIADGSLHASVNEDGNILHGKFYGLDPDHGDQTTLTYSPGASVPGFTLHQDGSYTFDPSNGAYQHLAETTWHPAHVYIPITVTDQDGLSTTQNLRLSIYGTNDAPKVSSAVTLTSGTEDTDVIIDKNDLLAHATDIDDGDHLHLGTVTADHGTLTDNHDGTYTFHPEPDYSGQVSFTYQVQDNHGATTTTTASMNLVGVSDAAIITGQDTGSITEDHHVGPSSAHPIQVMGSLSVVDPDAGENYFRATNPMVGHEKAISDPFQGRLHIDKFGNWDYSLANGNPAVQALAAGESRDVIYQVSSMDGTTHRITITVHGTNDAPVLQAQSQNVTEDGSLLSGQMVATDVDSGDHLTYSPPTQHIDGFTLNTDGSYAFDPTDQAYQHLAVGQTEKVTIPITVTDSQGATSTQDLVITVIGTNDGSVVTPLIDTVDEDVATHSLNLLSGATDADGDSLAISGMQFTVNGVATTGLPPGITLDADGHTMLIDTTGQEYQHLAVGQREQIKVSYMVEDGHGAQTPQTATLIVEGQDDKATLVSNVIQMTETVAYDSSMLGSVRGHLQLNDPDDGSSQQFLFSGTYAGQGQEPGHLTVWPDGSYEFNLNWAANRGARDVVDSLKSGETLEYKYNVQTADHQTKEVIIRITGEDDAARIEVNPMLPASQMVHEDQLAQGGSGHDLYAGGTLKVIDPDHDEAGFKPQNMTTSEGGHFHISERGSWSFVIDNNQLAVQQLGAGDTIVKTFTVESIDGSATQDIKVTIQGTNDIPVLQAQIQNVTEDGSLLSGQMVATDVDSGDNLTYSPPSQQVDGFTLNTDGSYTFDPTDQAYQHLAAGQREVVRIPITVSDSQGATSTQNLEITITGTDDKSVITGTDTAVLQEDSKMFGHTLETNQNQLTITDPDASQSVLFVPTGNAHGSGSSATGSWVSGSQGVGEFILHADGRWLYKADNNDPRVQGLADGEKLTETLTVHGTNGSTHTITGTIIGTNDAPTINGTTDLGATDQGQSITLTQSELTAHVTDIDGDKVTVSAVSVDPAAGAVTSNPDGSFTFTPAPGFSGDNVPVKFTATDGRAISHGAAIIDVHQQVNHAPVIDIGLFTSHKSGPNLVGTIGAKDPDHGDTLHWSVVTPTGGKSASSHGQFGSFNLDSQTGAFSYSPDGGGGQIHKSGGMPSAGQVVDSFRVAATDNHGLSHEMQVDIQVETNAHHVHGASGHWVAKIVPVSASMNAPTAHDEPVADIDSSLQDIDINLNVDAQTGDHGDKDESIESGTKVASSPSENLQDTDETDDILGSADSLGGLIKESGFLNLDNVEPPKGEGEPENHLGATLSSPIDTGNFTSGAMDLTVGKVGEDGVDESEPSILDGEKILPMSDDESIETLLSTQDEKALIPVEKESVSEETTQGEKTVLPEDTNTPDTDSWNALLVDTSDDNNP